MSDCEPLYASSEMSALRHRQMSLHDVAATHSRRLTSLDSTAATREPHHMTVSVGRFGHSESYQGGSSSELIILPRHMNRGEV